MRSVTQDAEGLAVEGSVGRPEERRTGDAIAGDRPDLTVELGALVARREVGHRRMGVGAVADRKAGAHDVKQRLVERGDLVSDDEEGARRLLAQQGSHHLAGVGAGTVVEGQRDLRPARRALGDEGRVGEDVLERAMLAGREYREHDRRGLGDGLSDRRGLDGRGVAATGHHEDDERHDERNGGDGPPPADLLATTQGGRNASGAGVLLVVDRHRHTPPRASVMVAMGVLGEGLDRDAHDQQRGEAGSQRDGGDQRDGADEAGDDRLGDVLGVDRVLEAHAGARAARAAAGGRRRHRPVPGC